MSSRVVRGAGPAAIAAGLALFLSGCAGGGSVPVSPDARAAIAALASPPSELDTAHAIAVRDCLHSAGFELPFGAAGAARERAALVGVQGLFASAENAATVGYETTMRSEPSPIERFEATLSGPEAERFDVAYRGTGDQQERITLSSGAVIGRNSDGCRADADRAIYGSVSDALLIQSFVNEVNALVGDSLSEISGALEAGLPEYQTCMSEAGVVVQGLGAEEVALERFGEYRSSGVPPSEAEQTLARTDFGCQEQAGLAEAVNAKFVDLASAWIVENEGYILATDELLRDSLARATELIQGS